MRVSQTASIVEAHEKGGYRPPPHIAVYVLTNRSSVPIMTNNSVKDTSMSIEDRRILIKIYEEIRDKYPKNSKEYAAVDKELVSHKQEL